MSRSMFFSLVVLLFTVSISICLGPNSEASIFSLPSVSTILLFRLPRILLGAMVGSSLSVSGATLQSMFRNDLASPYTLGISSAGALGASIAIFLHMPATMTSILAILLTFLSLIFIISIYYKQLQNSREYILLVGVSLGFLCSSLIVAMQFLGGAEISFSIQKWLIGSLQVVGFGTCIMFAPFVILSSFILVKYSGALDILQLGSDFALAKGVDTKRVGMNILLAVAALVGMLVSLVGPIAFVGLLVPQVVKLYVPSVHRYLLWYSAVYGAVFLMVADCFSRILMAPSEVPVGVLTSLIGAPLFVCLLLKEQGRKSSS